MREHFDLRPAAILRDLDLRRPIYAKTAAYGHFGRDDHDFTWERTDKADAAPPGRRPRRRRNGLGTLSSRPVSMGVVTPERSDCAAVEPPPRWPRVQTRPVVLAVVGAQRAISSPRRLGERS